MKRGNVTILASILAIGLVMMGVGMGTMAWFSDTGTASTGPIITGTLSMGTPTVTFSSSAPTNWCPGESFVVEFHIANDGTLDILYLGGNLVITRDDNDLSTAIEVTKFEEHIPGHGWIDNLGTEQHYHTIVEDKQEPFTLRELAQSYHSGEPAWASGRKQDDYGGWVGYITDWITGSGYDITPGPAIRVRQGTEEYILLLELTLSGPLTTNAHQNARLNFKIDFMAAQDTSQFP